MFLPQSLHSANLNQTMTRVCCCFSVFAVKVITSSLSSTLARACTPLTKSEGQERLLAVYLKKD